MRITRRAKVEIFAAGDASRLSIGMPQSKRAKERRDHHQRNRMCEI
jgi:hypothetical protein